ncbi:YbaB/EbfC family nucleoid-associated protein [Actinosynnema sp. NPDC020468]|uniref:YbaB/EbfC family nucleoid-associated protein n=1 Tax=Actinosynnema sp. NPDC020468 TaxID=3154488 RepID=UPI0033D53805
MSEEQRPVQAGDLRGLAETLQRQAARYGELQGRLDRTAVSAASPDDAVRVTVDASGAPTAIAFTERFRALDTEAMAALVLATVRQAQVRLRDRVAELTAETVGDDAPGQDIVAGYRTRFPDPPEAEDQAVRVLRFDNEDTPAPPAPRPPRPRPTGDDEDFGGGGFLR